MNDLLEILAEFGGGRGDPGDNVVRFLIPATFWLIIAFVAIRQWRSERDRKDLYVGIAALLGLSRELLMFFVYTLDWLGHVSRTATDQFYPPLEHAVSLLAAVLVASAFLRYFARRTPFPRAYLWIGAGAVAVIYAITAPAWFVYIGQHPAARYGQHWGDLVFRSAGSILMGTALGAFLLLGERGARIPAVLKVAFLFFFLDDTLMIANLATGDVSRAIYGPIRHNLHMWAVPLLLWVYWSEMHARLAGAEQERKAVFNLSPSMLCVADFSGAVRTVSPASAHVLGLPPEALVGRNLEEFGCCVEEWNAPPVLSMVACEGQYVAADGSSRWLQWTIQPVAEERLLYAVASDITGRKAAEETLKASEEKYRTMIEHSNDLIWTLDRQGNFLWFNKQAEEVSGYPVDDWVGKSFAPLIEPDDLPMVGRVFTETMAGRPQTYEVRVRRKDGDIIFLLVNSAPIFTDGEVTGTVSFGKEITDRKRAQTALRIAYDELEARVEERTAKLARANVELRESEERYRTLAETAPDMIFIVDRAGHTQYANSGVARRFGIQPAEFIGKRVEDLFPPHLAEEQQRMLQSVFETGALVYHQFEAVFPDGNDWLGTWLAPMKAHTGEVRAVLGISRVITEQIQTQERLKAALVESLQRRAEVYTLLEATRSVLQRPQFHDAARSIGESLKGLLGAAAGCFALLGEGSAADACGCLALLTEGGDSFDPNELLCKAGETLPMPTSGPQAEACRTGTVVVENVFPNSNGSRPLPEGHIRLENALFAPLVIEGKTAGLFCLANKPGGFTDNDAYLASAFADLAAVALRNSHTAEALAESERRFRELAEHVPDAVFRYRFVPTRRMEYVSPSLAALTGYTPEELYSAPDAKIIVHPDHYPQVDAISASPEAFLDPVRLRWLRKDGTPFWIEQVTTPLYDEEGQLVAIEGSARDVTDQVWAEEQVRNALGESRRRQVEVAALLEASHAVLQHLRFEDAARAVFSSCKKLIGATTGFVALVSENGLQHGFVLLDPEELGHAIDLSATVPTRGLRGEAFRQGKAVFENDFRSSESSRLVPEGHPQLENVLFAPMMSHGDAVGLLALGNKPGGFTEDDARMASAFGEIAAIALRNSRTAEALAESERVLRHLAEHTPDAIFRYRIAPDLRKEYLSPSFATMTGYDLEELYADPHWTAVHPEDLPLVEAVLQSPESFTKPVSMRWVRKDGAVIWVEVLFVPLYDEAGSVIGFEGSARDITERKRSQEELERAQNEFLGMVTHELRTPLTAIKGAAATGLGSYRPLDMIETQELFQIVDHQTDRLRDLVSNLLDMSRIEAGALPVRPEPTDLRPIFDEARATFLRAGGPNPVTTHVPEGLPQVKADANRIIQVLTNLLNNAAKSCSPEAPILIGAKHDGLQVTVHVCDQGRGIPKDRLGDLFKKFSQVHRDEESRSGTGLGLAICKGIIEAHGGRMWAESEGEGMGATFSFALPVATVETAGASNGGPPPITRRDRHEKRILAVDDDVQILRYLQRSLEEAGFEPLTTSDAASALEQLELGDVDLVLLDMVLPDTNGFEVLRRIRRLSEVPVIFLSGHTKNEDMVRALKMGADDYITKPFAPSELLARIEVALRRHALSQPQEDRPPLVFRDLVIDFSQRRVTVGDRPVALTTTEYKLLCALASQPGRILTHTQILRDVWGETYGQETELLRSFVRNLRRKLGDDATNPRYIVTERQVGYFMPKP